jgi:hypothetical protein
MTGQGGRHHRQTDLLGALDRRLHRLHAFFFHEAVDVLQHHDRVVDHDAHRQGQR